jgi:hypothetical protein
MPLRNITARVRRSTAAKISSFGVLISYMTGRSINFNGLMREFRRDGTRQSQRSALQDRPQLPRLLFSPRITVKSSHRSRRYRKITGAQRGHWFRHGAELPGPLFYVHARSRQRRRSSRTGATRTLASRHFRQKMKSPRCGGHRRQLRLPTWD